MKGLMLSALLCLLFCASAFSQKFWLTTYEFPGGPKTGIAAIGDTCLIAGLTNGVLRSFDEGQHWDKVLEASAIYTVHATPEGIVLAGGKGKIFRSSDFGSTWDSVALGHNYPVLKFAHQTSGGLFAITGYTDLLLGFVGAGVYFSSDDGLSWVQRNTGLNNNLDCDQITVDQYDRVYITVRDEDPDGPGGLYYSDNSGLQWQHVNIAIDGQNVIYNEINVGTTLGLSISNQDSLYISLEGISGTVEVRLNLHKSLADLTSDNFWNTTKVSNSISWWLERPLNDIHFAQNGDRYSSFSGPVSIGGTFFRKNETGNWNRQLQGLGLDVFGFFSAQTFAEKSSGKIFMVQYLDERIYWADTSRTTAVHDIPVPEQNQWSVYPNPVPTGGTMHLLFEQDPGKGIVQVVDLFGRLVSSTPFSGQQVEVDAPDQPGTYFLRAGSLSARVICH